MKAFKRLFLFRVVRDVEAKCWRYTVSIDFDTCTGIGDTRAEATEKAWELVERMEARHGATPAI
jgi:hypothetical protein